MTHAHEFSPNGSEAYNNPNEVLLDFISNKYPEILQDEKSLEIARLALESIDRRYGDLQSVDYRHYHNGKHTRGVVMYSLINNDITLEEFDTKPNINGRKTVFFGTLFHDFIVGQAGKVGTLRVQFGDFEIVVENDGQKTDEEMSTECARQVLQHYGIDEGIIEGAVSGIFATEVIHAPGRVLPTERALMQITITDQVIRFTDTSRIIAQGMDAGIEDMSNLAAEVSKDKGIAPEDTSSLMEEIMKIVSSQSHFISDRLTISKQASAMLPFSQERIQNVRDDVENRFKNQIERAVGYGAFIAANLTEISDSIRSTLDETRSQTVDTSERIKSGLIKAIDGLSKKT